MKLCVGFMVKFVNGFNELLIIVIKILISKGFIVLWCVLLFLLFNVKIVNISIVVMVNLMVMVFIKEREVCG